MKIGNLRTTTLAAIALPALMLATGAQAHAHVTSSVPAANATGAAPKVIHLEFNEGVEPKFSGVELMKADGSAAPVEVKIAGKSVDATPTSALAPGSYMVMWHTVADDGHKSKGQFNFTVR